MVFFEELFLKESFILTTEGEEDRKLSCFFKCENTEEQSRGYVVQNPQYNSEYYREVLE